VATAEACYSGGARPADRVELVDEDDCRGRLLRLGEQVTHARRPDTDDRLDELGGGQREERHVRLARDRPREQGLPGAGWAREEHAVRNPATELSVPLRMTQEVDDLCQLRLRFVDARHVRERDAVAGRLVS